MAKKLDIEDCVSKLTALDKCELLSGHGAGRSSIMREGGLTRSLRQICGIRKPFHPLISLLSESAMAVSSAASNSIELPSDASPTQLMEFEE